jgi:asparagine synthase (glutamine-hydrolysing)
MIDKSYIRDILTLRYHPRANTVLPKLGWQHFLEYNGIAQFIQPLMEETIRRIINVNRDKKVGIGISGGVDSSVVLALTRKCFPELEINTFCITFGDDDREAKDAQHVSELYSTNHEHIHIENPFETLREQIAIVGEPRWNLYPYFLFREASKNCDLLLSGDGGDELFGGYVFRYKYLMQNSCPGNPIQRYLEAHSRDWVPDQEELFAFPFNWNDIYNLLRPYFENPLPPIGKVFLADYNGKLLNDFAPTNAAFSEHFKIRTIAPMLEPEVLFVATHLPYSLKYDHKSGLGKIILRQILLENSGYKPAVKEKIGWGMDIVEMWDKYVRDMCESALSSARSVEIGIISKEWLPKGFRKANEHDLRYISKMFGLLALEIWLEINKI